MNIKIKTYQLFYLLVIVLFTLTSSCTHRVVRTGYEKPSATTTDCEVAILKSSEQLTRPSTKLGEIKLGESGFSTACSEAHAMAILKKEACSLGANLIVITDENRPDMWSSCYRCEAMFYTADIEGINSAVSFEKEQVTQRVQEDKKQNAGMFIVSLIAGFIVGIIIFN